MNYKNILKKLPYELQEKILNYYYKNSISYKNYITQFYNLNRYPYLVKFNKINKIYKSHENLKPWHHLLYENFNKNQAAKYVANLSHCKCCSRHQINKPKSLTDRFQYPMNEKDENFYFDANICKCTCRHISRALCFVYHN